MAGLRATMPRIILQCSSILRSFLTNHESLEIQNGTGSSAIFGSCFYLLFVSLQTLRSWSQIRCLAHIINLATQALIATYSKTPHFEPGDPDAHEPELETLARDEVGLVRALAVKVNVLNVLYMCTNIITGPLIRKEEGSSRRHFDARQT